MIERTAETELTFRHPFHLQALTQALPSGTYRFVVREEMIESLPLPAYENTYRGLEIPAIHVATGGKRQHVAVGPGEIEAAQERDRSGSNSNGKAMPPE